MVRNIFKKKRENEDIPVNIDSNNTDDSKISFFETKLPEKIIELLTVHGNEQRLASLSKGERNILTKIIVKNNIIYGNKKSCNAYIGAVLNLSVSQDALLIKQIVELSRPKLTDIKEGV